MEKKKYNKLLNMKSNSRLSKGQKVLWGVFASISIGICANEAFVYLYNYFNRADTTEIKLPTSTDLFPNSQTQSTGLITPEGEEVGIEEQKIIEKANTNYSLDFLNKFIKKEVSEKLKVNLADEFEVVAIFEGAKQSASFDKQDTFLSILIKNSDSTMNCLIFNNSMATSPLEQSGAISDNISSLIVHLQQSSIIQFEKTDEEKDNIAWNKENIAFIGDCVEYTEKNGAKAYMIPVYSKTNDKYTVEYYKNTVSELSKYEDLTPMMALCLQLSQGENMSLMPLDLTVERTKCDDFNNMLKDLRGESALENAPENDLLPEDEFASDTQSHNENDNINSNTI